MRSATRKKRWKDTHYLQWLHLQPCIITGVVNAALIGNRVRYISVHHVKECPGGPRADRRGVPLMDYLHMLTHEIPGQPCVERGRRVFEEYWQVDLEAEIRKLNARYELEMGAYDMKELRIVRTRFVGAGPAYAMDRGGSRPPQGHR